MTMALTRIRIKYYTHMQTTGHFQRLRLCGPRRVFPPHQGRGVAANDRNSLTDFNVAVSVLSMFVLLVKVIMFVLHIWWPILGTISNAVITALWIVSMYGQMGPDHSDPRYPSNVAWYISKGCDYATPHGAYGYCRQAQAAYAVTVVMM